MEWVVKILFSTILLSFIVAFSFASASAYEIPGWVKSNAEWWAQDQIDDSTFVSGIEYLVKEGVIQISETTQASSSISDEIPGWIKNNADWWSQGLISDEDFIKGVQYLVENGIIVVSQTELVGKQSSEQTAVSSEWQTFQYGDLASFKYPPDWTKNGAAFIPVGTEKDFAGFVKVDNWYFLPDEKERKMAIFDINNEKVSSNKITINGHPGFLQKGTGIFVQTPVNEVWKSAVLDMGGNYQVVQIISKFDSSKYSEYEEVVEKIIDSFEILK